MKEISKIKKLVLTVIIAVIIAGITVTILYGINKGIEYKESTKIEVNIPNGYEKEDIEQIAKESFSDKNILVQDIEKTKQVVSVRIGNFTEDELNIFKAKISEKYNIEQDKLVVYEIEVPETKIFTLVNPYMFSVSLVTVLSIVYIALRNIKKDALSKVIRLLLSLIVVIGLYFSIIAIARIPINQYIMPMALTLYVATILITVVELNKESKVKGCE